jgi:DNA-binding LacI/PurR family transcriptional regulator/DNA-binding transcriptional regulator YhcF (GntR family)
MIFGKEKNKKMAAQRNTIKFREIYETIKKQIHEGYYKPGATLPSEDELCLQYQVSRTTIRLALSLLTQEGLIVRERGRNRGTTVTNNARKPVAGSPATPDNFGFVCLEEFLFSRISDNHHIMQTILSCLHKHNASLSLFPLFIGDDEIDVCRSVINKGLVQGLFLAPMRFLKTIVSWLEEKNVYAVLFRSCEDVSYPPFINTIFPYVVVRELAAISKFIKSVQESGIKKIVLVGFEGIELEFTLKLFVAVRRFCRLNFETVSFKPAGKSFFARMNVELKKYCLPENLIVVSSQDMISYVKAFVALNAITLPHDVSILIYEHNGYIGDEVPPLFSAVRRPYRELGIKAAQLMMEQIKGKKVPHLTECESFIQSRDTVRGEKKC